MADLSGLSFDTSDGGLNVHSKNAVGGAATIADGADVTQGAKADSSASSDTGTFSIISLIKRLLTKLQLAQQTMSNSLSVAIASDQTPKTTSTATRTNVAGANSDTSLLASNANRKGATFFNDSTAILYLAYGSSAASLTSYTVQIAPGGFFEMPVEPIFTGAIRGIWAAANGNVRITELS
jgi:hypothetical protein